MNTITIIAAAATSDTIVTAAVTITTINPKLLHLFLQL